MMTAAKALLALGLFAATPAFAQDLAPEAEAALAAALQDERHAEAFYAAVIAKHGEVKPFSNIIQSERKHEAMIISLYEAYGAAVPENGYTSGALPALEAPEALVDACKTGVAAEIANRDLYDVKLLPAVTAYPDITLVLQRLRDASEQNHLPAFERCVSRG